MSTNLQFRLTSAGQAAAWNASNTGIALELTHVQFGSGNRAPTGTETALVTPRAYVAIAAGNRVSPNQIRLSAMLTGTSSFNIAEIGIWKGVPGQAGSVLFAYWSQASGVLGAKAPGVDFIFTHDMVLSDAVAAGSVIVVADTNQSAMLALMAEHETKPDPHVGYMLESVLELTAVPAQKIAPIICVTQPYFRMMVWDGSQYVRVPIVSPNLTGVPTAPTAPAGTNTEQIASTEFVMTEVSSVSIPAASETVAGKIEIATSAEVAAGTDAVRAITPAGLRKGLNASGTSPIYSCRAWVNFNGTGTVSIRASGNVSSITDNGVGDYTINFTVAMPDANYSVAQCGSSSPSNTANRSMNMLKTSAPETTGVRVQHRGDGSASIEDCMYGSIAIFR